VAVDARIVTLDKESPIQGEEPEQPGDEARGAGRLVAMIDRP
jgi:hypothetical protein